jgi:thiamine phosphate synthase YjbQ (UPF0047 family)
VRELKLKTDRRTQLIEITDQVREALDGGRLGLGRYQTIFFCEFDGPRDRKVYVTPLR